MELTINDLKLIRLENGYVDIYVKVTAIELGKTLTEEFHIGRQWKGQRVITDARGWMLATNGTYYDPSTFKLSPPQVTWQKEAIQQDLVAEVKDVIIKTMKGKFARGVKQDSMRLDFLKTLIQSKTPIWTDSKQLPLTVRQLVGKTETV